MNTASILAMQRLVNGNCPYGGGLDLLCMDEILDAVDADGLASVFAALNKQSVTALVVSHGLVQENYPHRITVTKENGAFADRTAGLTRSRRTHLAFYRTLRKAPLRNGIRCIVARM